MRLKRVRIGMLGGGMKHSAVEMFLPGGLAYLAKPHTAFSFPDREMQPISGCRFIYLVRYL
jgi:hypothetical protein